MDEGALGKKTFGAERTDADDFASEIDGVVDTEEGEVGDGDVEARG